MEQSWRARSGKESDEAMKKPKSNEKTPVVKGEVIELTIRNYGHEGEGVGRYRDFTIFVAGALQGESVRIRVDGVKKNFARGTLLEVLQPAPARINPPCAVYRDCGGCQLQQLDYRAQMEMKRESVVAAVERIGCLAGVIIHPVIGMETPWYYRNKVQYPVGFASDGRIEVGFYRMGTHEIVPAPGCLLQPEKMNRIIVRLREILTNHRVSIYDEQTGEGLLRHVLLRKGWESGTVMVVLVTNGARFPESGLIVTDLTAAFPEIGSMIQNINCSRGNVILGPDSRVLFGKEAIVDELDGLKFKISARSFFQVNPAQTGVLYGKAVEYAGLTGAETVVDAYCGVGSLTLFLARKAKTVYGIEVVPEAIRDAKENAALNRIGNTRFLVGATEKVLPELFKEGKRFDVGVVDPPRSGCERSVLESFADNRVGRIVYVSCNPSTLARDLKVLAELGYRTAEIQPVDMFPQTYHVECVALIEQK
jgi:23S rRNA (uracil1939-C5)-methyltransferase